MTISMSGTSINDKMRGNLLDNSVNTNQFGGVRANETVSHRDSLSSREAAQYKRVNRGEKRDMGLDTSGDYYWVPSGAALAGITDDFVQVFSSALTSYCAEVTNTLNKIEAVATNNAFRGSAISSALSNFVESIKDVAFSYVNAVRYAEAEIIRSVESSYKRQDSDLSSNLKSDTKKLEDMRAVRGCEVMPAVRGS